VERAEFAPEPLTPFYQRSVYQGMRGNVTGALAALRRGLRGLSEDAQADARALLEREAELLALLRPLTTHTFSGARIRTHGDYRLEQALVTGGDVALIDLEGDPARSVSERRIKRSPLRDVAGMLRSFERAAFTALSDRSSGGGVHRLEDLALLRPRALLWTRWAAAVFLEEYLRAAAGAVFLPATAEETTTLLRCFLVDQTAAELASELERRPERAGEVAAGLVELLG
jgi:maltose alpha-D-glucosyltransferase/alpha-amylase